MKLRRISEKDMQQLVMLTPEEQAQSDEFEAKYPHLDELQASIDRAKDPKVKAVLQEEMDKRTAPPKLTKVQDDVPKLRKVQDDPPFVPSNPADEMGHVGRFAAGVGSGLTSTYRGAKQSGLGGLEYLASKFSPDSDVAKYLQSAKTNNQAAIDEQTRLDKNLLATGAGLAGNIVGQAAPMMAVPLGGIGAAGSIGGALVKGGAQGLINGALSSRPSDENATKFWMMNAALGGAGNTLLHGAGSAVNAVRGKFRDFPDTIGHQATPVEAYEAAKRQGVPVSIGDIAPTSWWRNWENTMDRYIPMSGRQGSMEKQAQAVSDRLKEVQVQNQGKAKGQKAISNAVDKALNPNNQGSLSTKAFLDALELAPSSRAKMFPGQMGQDVGDLETALRAVNRVDDYAASAPAKVSNMRTVVGGLGFGIPGVTSIVHMPVGLAGVGAGAGIIGGSRLSNVATDSDIGKRMFLADPERFSKLTKTGSRMLPAAWEDLMMQLYGQ